MERVNKKKPHAWIVTTVFDRISTLKSYLECLNSQTYKEFWLVLVDHGFNEVTKEITFPDYVFPIRESPKKWWTAAVNAGISYALEHPYMTDQDVILLQNDDSIFGPGFVGHLVSIAGTEQAVVGGVAIDAMTKRILHANLKFNKRRAAYEYLHYGKPTSDLAEKLYDSDILKGRGTAYPVSVVREIGLLDERLPQYKSDHEWAHRAKTMGYGVYVTPRAISETVLDTQEQISSVSPFLSFWRVLFSRRSPRNVADTVKYFFICFHPVQATYYCLVDISRTGLVSLITAILYKLKIWR